MNNGNNSHIYDNKGRITNNSQLGDYTYNNYQQTQLNNLVSTAHSWYQDRALQQINYNAFKSPVEINEEGKERISFQYNAGLQRAHMYYGSTATEKMDRPYRRHYSEDGTMEITEDIQNGTTNFVFYLGGDAYSAPAIWKEIHHSNAQPLDAQLYFLHRDHLGSIVMITDAAGNVAEKRQFDAWGNIVKLEDGNGVPLTAFVILDRGYTGHEHLLGVGLIHMNGRLYDPKLHRFLQPDNYVQDPYNSQNFNRYGYVYNNPLSHVDPSGEFIPLLAIGIGALIGGYSGYKIGKANGATGWNMFGYIAGGALIGGASGGAAAGISAAGGGAILAGMGAGSLGGAGFSGLATGWNANAMLKGAFIGGISGAIGGGFASAIGGGAGAFFGGAASNITSQLLSTGDINFGQALLSGGISLGLYHGVSYASWKWGGGSTLGNQEISYRQYSTMQADFQRSRFWGKEYGGFLMDDGRVIRFPKDWRHSHGVEPPSGNGIKTLTGTKAIYHTHWDRPGKIIWTDAMGNRVDNSSNLSLIATGRQTTTVRGHSPYDYSPVNSFVINRYETTFNIGGSTNLTTINDSFLRFLLGFNLWQ